MWTCEQALYFPVNIGEKYSELCHTMNNMKCPSFPQSCISIYKWVRYIAFLVASSVAPFFPARILEVVGRLPMIQQCQSSVVTRMIGSLCISRKIVQGVSFWYRVWMFLFIRKNTNYCVLIFTVGYSWLVRINCDLTVDVNWQRASYRSRSEGTFSVYWCILMYTCCHLT
jgi:hypothetical protein